MCFWIALILLAFNYADGINVVTPGLFFWTVMAVAEATVDLKNQVKGVGEHLGNVIKKRR